jgi:hypothetical protein
MKLGRFMYLLATGSLAVCNTEFVLFVSFVRSRSERKLTYFNSVLLFPAKEGGKSRKPKTIPEV